MLGVLGLIQSKPEFAEDPDKATSVAHVPQ
jgi:hypothetical protein